MHNRALSRRGPDRVSGLAGIVAGMSRRIHDRTYRSPAELIRAIRDEHLLTQDELAGRAGLSRYQLCRWEKGAREPTLESVRRVLSAFGLAVTFGVEPSTAALDERLEPGVDAIGLDAWLLAHRVVWPAVARLVPVERQFVEKSSRRPDRVIDVPVVPLVALQESGILGSAAEALAARLLQRTIGSEGEYRRDRSRLP